MALTLSTAPTGEPVTLPELKAHFRVVRADEDADITRMGKAAREYCEQWTGRQFMLATYTLKLDAFWDGSTILELPRPPLLSVTSIAYTDSAGDAQTLSSAYYTVYTALRHSPFGGIGLAYGYSWPDTYAVPQAVTITYKAGYSASATLSTQRAAVPEMAKAAIKEWALAIYDGRGPSVQTVNDAPYLKNLMWGLRVPRLEIP